MPGIPRAVGRERVVPVVKAAAEVEAGAERASGAAQHDHLHVRVGARRVDRRLELLRHRRHDRVQPLGPVQRDRRDRLVGVVQQRLVSHDCPPGSTGGPRASAARARCAPSASAAPTRGRARRGSCSSPPACGRSSIRSSTTNPCSRNNAIQEPYGSWNSTGSSCRLEHVQVPVVARQPLARMLVRQGPHEIEDRGVHRERQQALRAQQPRRFRNGPVGVREGHRAVVAEDDVERGVRERRRLCARVHQRELDTRLSHQRARVLELGRGVVEPGHARAQRMQRDRPLRGAAAELEHVLAAHVPEDPQLGLRQLPDTPGSAARGRQLRPVLGLVVARVRVPQLPVAGRVRRELRLVAHADSLPERARSATRVVRRAHTRPETPSTSRPRREGRCVRRSMRSASAVERVDRADRGPAQRLGLPAPRPAPDPRQRRQLAVRSPRIRSRSVRPARFAAATPSPT